MNWEDYGSFTEMAFAVNVMFSTWSKPSEMLTEYVIKRARKEQLTKEELDRTMVSERIYDFQKECEISVSIGRIAAGICAFLIMAVHFYLPGNFPVSGHQSFLILASVSPPILVALYLGVRVCICVYKNRKDMQPQNEQAHLEVTEIADKISKD